MFNSRMKITSRTCNLSGLRKQPTCQDVVSPRTDVCETSIGIIYLWRVTTQIWAVFLTGLAAWEILTGLANRGEVLPKPGQ